MLEYIIPLIGSYFQSGMAEFWFWTILCFGILYLTPTLIRSCFTWR